MSGYRLTGERWRYVGSTPAAGMRCDGADGATRHGAANVGATMENANDFGPKADETVECIECGEQRPITDLAMNPDGTYVCMFCDGETCPRCGGDNVGFAGETHPDGDYGCNGCLFVWTAGRAFDGAGL